ncbi:MULTISPECIES: HPr family phosphocarrier protein [Clostridia]|uniref:HPr family phosphocarrier protein n=1 Tax=Clostridia TaxID=186801 RepID=UPI000E545495|nr:HPr family phosphocarrier protein [Clostridium sp. AM33-3]RHT16954.1 HPr family phosphocarrier protein [Clostridium sp. AM33-3]
MTVRLRDPEGLHVRNAAQIFAAAGGLNAQIRLCSGEKTARADHILELMAMEARAGDFIEIQACGEDAEQAVKTIAQILQK